MFQFITQVPNTLFEARTSRGKPSTFLCASHHTAVTLKGKLCTETELAFFVKPIHGHFTSHIVANSSPETASPGDQQPVETLAIDGAGVHGDN